MADNDTTTGAREWADRQRAHWARLAVWDARFWTPREGVHAYLTGRGRVWVETIDGDSAVVRFDCDDGLRSKCLTVKVADIDFAVEWKRRNA